MVKNNSVRWGSLFDPNQFIGSTFLGVVSGVAAGLVSGFAARAAMRVVALVAGQQPGFSLEGTLFIIGFGALLGVGPGLVYGFFLPFLPGSIRRKGVFLGVLLSVIITIPLLLAEPDGELALIPKWVTAALFATIPLVYGVILGLVGARLVSQSDDLKSGRGRFAQSAGLLTMIFGFIGGVIEIVLALTYPPIVTLGFATAKFLEGLVGVSVILMIITGIVGLARAGGIGNSSLGKIGLGVALMVIALLGAVSSVEGLSSVELHGLVKLVGRFSYDEDLLPLLLAFLLGIFGLLLGGLAVLRARRWSGWRAFVPLLLGLFPVLAFLLLHPSLFPSLADLTAHTRNQLGHWVGALFSFSWLVLGVALRIEAGQPEPLGSSEWSRDVQEVFYE